ncbi:MAG: hypothetical protein JJ916_04045 [Phycisphaerales bacterium]|nr:hypothetical protein [Phycisphaerales bacterium]
MTPTLSPNHTPEARATPIERAIAHEFPFKHCNRLAEPGFKWNRHQAQVIRQAQVIIDHGGMVVVQGVFGNGKTQIGARFGCQWFKELRRGPSPRYFVSIELLDAHRDSYGEKHESPMVQAESCGLLVLDDLRVPTGKTDHDYEQLNKMLDIRYRSERPTLILTNLGDAGLNSVLGEKTIDRISDGGALIELQGKSMRGVA